MSGLNFDQNNIAYKLDEFKDLVRKETFIEVQLQGFNRHELIRPYECEKKHF